MDSGEHGERNRLGCGGVHVSPLSRENISHCLPVLVRQ